MLRGINKAILIGMLDNNPELKYTLSGKAVANFTLAVQDKWGNAGNRKHTEVFAIEARGRGAEYICKYFKKGDYVYLEGILRSDRWDKDGSMYYTSKLVVQDFLFLPLNAERSEGSKNDGSSDV